MGENTGLLTWSLTPPWQLVSKEKPLYWKCEIKKEYPKLSEKYNDISRF